jgi:hypothetical protein
VMDVHLLGSVVRVELEVPFDLVDPMDMHRSITALGGDKLIQGVPRDSLNVVRVISDRLDARP